ncbi:heavy metal translocating P-type ATPase [Rhabdaerophilum sp. SD176]|uniref:heavy metal translocating P-type ATPase n=1 Tax=Rhabdaerophilum sp. SD176 TaxID=2983548 RepID=UPI0024DF9551|nr:heavy metal translocating P-type ATPase [Rhabdaerophilum sp. SD176]
MTRISSSQSAVTASWLVSGMDCASCAAKIRGAVERLPGVSDVKLSVMTETLTLALDEHQTKPTEVERKVSDLGYFVQRVEKPVREEDSNATSCGCGHAHEHKHGDHDHEEHGHDNHDHDTSLQNTSQKADSGHGLPGHLHEATPDGVSWYQTGKGRLVLGTGALLAAAWGLGLIAPAIAKWAFIAACLIGVAPVARRAFAALRAGMPFTIEMLMTIAAAGALVIGAAEEAALVVFLFAVGEVLEGVAANRARASIKALGDLVPKTAIVEEEGELHQVNASSLKIGQILLVRPGDRIPADGEISEGTSGIDESPVTGESVPKTKTLGEPVFAGSINREAVLRVRVTKTAEDNTIARIVRLVEEAQEARAPTERFIDRFSRFYMPAIVGLAILVALVPPLAMGGDWNTWIYRALALLLIGCPCALVISVPASIASALSTGAKNGLLMKGGVVIENLARVKTVAFDKTGTLTVGKPVVTNVRTFNATEAEVLALAAGVETGSSHPLAEAILALAASKGITPKIATDARAIVGRGVEAKVGGENVFVGSPRFAAEIGALSEAVSEAAEALEAEGKTVAAVFRGGRVIGLFALRDEPREDAKIAIAELKVLGVGSVMLTGDNARTGAAIAGSLGMDHKAELMPDQKVAAIKSLAAHDGVMMVGDGINDAPALAAASVGVAMGSGTDVALETADAAVLRSRVTDVPRMIRLSRAAMANIHQNIAIALGLKAVFLVTSVIGLTGLWIAILADTGATVIVTINALRLLTFKPEARS